MPLLRIGKGFNTILCNLMHGIILCFTDFKATTVNYAA